MKSKETKDDLLTVEQIGKEFNLPPVEVRGYIKRCSLPHVRDFRGKKLKVLIRHSGFLEWLDTPLEEIKEKALSSLFFLSELDRVRREIIELEMAELSLRLNPDFDPDALEKSQERTAALKAEIGEIVSSLNRDGWVEIRGLGDEQKESKVERDDTVKREYYGVSLGRDAAPPPMIMVVNPEKPKSTGPQVVFEHVSKVNK